MKRDFSHIRSHRFRERRYDIYWKLPKKCGTCGGCGGPLNAKADGECDPPTNLNKSILIGPKLPEHDLLETAVHESLHACLWDVDEQAVSDTARDIARLLRRMGFKLD